MNLRAPWHFPTLVGLILLLLSLCSADDYQPTIKMSTHSQPGFALYRFRESSNVILLAREAVSISFDDGANWSDIPELKDAIAIQVEMDPYDKSRALIFLRSGAHFVLNDQGKTWSAFEVLTSNNERLHEYSFAQVSYNHAKREYLLLEFRVCTSLLGACTTSFYYSKDGLKTNPKLVMNGATSCVFARSNPEFDNLVKPETLFCSKNDVNSFGHVTKSQLLYSTDFFKTSNSMDQYYLKYGEIIDVRVESAFLVVVFKKDKFNEAQVSLIVSRDASTFSETSIDFEIKYGAVIFLNSTPQSLRLSLFYQGKHTKEQVLYFSDSTGTKFEKVADIGLFSSMNAPLVNGVWFADVKRAENIAEYPTRYSFDDCETWNPLKIIGDDTCVAEKGCALNFIPEGATDINARLPATPDIRIAVGSKGESFNMDSSLDTYVSRDGGASWKFALLGPVLSAFADLGNIIAAVPAPSFGLALETLHFSLDQGGLWNSMKLPQAIRPILMLTASDLSGTKILVLGQSGLGSVLYLIDFGSAFDGKACGKDDMETVDARVSPELKAPICIYGEKNSFLRRKQDAKCLVKDDAMKVKVSAEACQCSASDFECAPAFELSDKGACVPVYEKIAALCKAKMAKKIKLSHLQLILGDACTMSKGSQSDFIAETEFDCTKLDDETGLKDKSIVIKVSELDGIFDQYSYVQSENLTNNILVHTNKNRMHASNNGGTSFVEVPVHDDIWFFLVGPVKETALLVSYDSIYYSDDGGNTFTKRKAPGTPTNIGAPVIFDPLNAERFLFMVAGADNFGSRVFLTEDAGETFTQFSFNAINCAFVDHALNTNLNLMYCAVSDGQKTKILASKDFFKTYDVLFENALAFAVKSDFVLFALVTDDMQHLRLKVTADGKTMADADFPSDFRVEAQTAYTILTSHPHSLFVHVTTDRTEGHERGAILKSNSNGTSYVLSLDNVNRNSKGYVDYDRIESLEGVLLANTVSNPNSQSPKKLKSQISFNDGSQWSYITPPTVDSNGKKYSCNGGSLAKCSLNLHGFTERPDYRDTFSSTSAVGILIGVGSVGEYLQPYLESSTFISTDGGVTWKEIKKGAYTWEYGDRGTILLLVAAYDKTDEFIYSTDDGQTWVSYKFSDKPVEVQDLATVPTDSSRKFVIFAQDPSRVSNTVVYSIDFTNFYKRQCQIDLDRPLEDDFEYWAPTHPESTDGCLFGHETNYLRRAKGHNDCFIGAAPLNDGVKIVRNCSCTRRDYECDYNYFRDTDGTCKLVKGLTPQDRKDQMCSKPGTFEYFEPTGYRKIPLSTCVGGKSFDSWNVRPCPGHEKEFNDSHGRTIGLGKLLLLFLIPGAVFLGATWFVYEKGIRRNGGFKRFGQIRLDEDIDFHPIEENNVDVVVNKIVRGGIVLAAGTFAVFKTVILIDRKMLEGVARIVFGRRAGRRDYVRVPDDDDELFGNFDDNYDDELGDESHIDFAVQEEPEEFDDFVSNETANADARLFDIDDEESQAQSDTGTRED